VPLSEIFSERLISSVAMHLLALPASEGIRRETRLSVRSITGMEDPEATHDKPKAMDGSVE